MRTHRYAAMRVAIALLLVAAAVPSTASAASATLADDPASAKRWHGSTCGPTAGGDAAPPERVWNLLSHNSGLQREPPGPDREALQAPSLEEVVTATSGTALTRGVESVAGFTVDGSGRATGFKVEIGTYGDQRVD